MILDFLFFLFAATALVSAVFVITRDNPVASVMFLVVTLFCTAALFVLMDAHFVAAVQVIVYAGAIMVLFLFVVMLLNVVEGEGLAEYRGALARMLAVSFALALAAFLTRGMLLGEEQLVLAEEGENVIVPLLEAEGAIAALARPLFRDYLVPFEVVGLLLLVSIIGAILLTRRSES